LSYAQFAAGSWIVIGSFFFVSELVSLLSDQFENDGLLFVALVPLGATGLILIGVRLFEYLKSHSDKANIRRAALVVGVLAVASVPAFFHATIRPDRYALALAWPLILLGGLGFVLVVTVLISHLSGPKQRSRNVWAWVGFGIFLGVFAWLDSSPTSTYLPILDWRVRSVVIFTCVLLSFSILTVIVSRVLLKFIRHSFANGN